MIIGIDLDTTNSLVAVRRDGSLVLIPSARGAVLTPSAVGIAGDGTTLVGQAARDRLSTRPDRDAASGKRWLGAPVPIVGRMLLGRGRPGFSRFMAGDPRLKRRHGEYLLHASVVGDRFDPARTGAIGRLLIRPPHPRVERASSSSAWW